MASVLGVRRAFATLEGSESIEVTDRLIQMLARTRDNAEFVETVRKGMGG